MWTWSRILVNDFRCWQRFLRDHAVDEPAGELRHRLLVRARQSHDIRILTFPEQLQRRREGRLLAHVDAQVPGRGYGIGADQQLGGAGPAAADLLGQLPVEVPAKEPDV